MSNASAEDIAKLTQRVQNDPAIRNLIARGVIKYSDLLNADGTVNATRVKQISDALAKRGLAEKSQGSQIYNMYARQQTTPGFKSTGLPSGLQNTEAWPNLTPPSSKMGHIWPILVFFPKGLYSATRLCAPHVSLPDRSRCETADRD